MQYQIIVKVVPNGQASTMELNIHIGKEMVSLEGILFPYQLSSSILPLR